MDIVTAESLFGYEPHSNDADYLMKSSKQRILNDTNKYAINENKYSSTNNQHGSRLPYGNEKVILPDTSSFFFPLEMYGKKKPSRMISFPKYNNFMLSPDKFDKQTKVMVPLDLLGISQPDEGEITIQSLTRPRSVLSYVQYREAGLMFPQQYDYTVSRRWGVDMIVASPIISVTILVPGYNNDESTVPPSSDVDTNNYSDSQIQIVINDQTLNRTTNNNVLNEMNPLLKSLNNPRTEVKDDILSFTQDVKHSHDNRLSYMPENPNYDNAFFNDIKSPQALPLIEDGKHDDAKLVYKPLGGLDLKQPIRLQMWLKLENLHFIPKANPQCVHWRVTNG